MYTIHGAGEAEQAALRQGQHGKDAAPDAGLAPVPYDAGAVQGIPAAGEKAKAVVFSHQR